MGQDWLEGEDYIAGAMPVRQRLHNLAQTHGILVGTGVNVSAPYGGDQAKTIAELVWVFLINDSETSEWMFLSVSRCFWGGGYSNNHSACCGFATPD